MDTYLISQILVVISTIFIGLSYFAKDKKTIMFLCVIYCIFYASHYLLLSALTGFTMSLISAVRNYIFYKNSKKNKKNKKRLLILFILFAIISGIFTYQDYFSIISISASIISTYSIWQTDVKKYRLLAIPVSLCFITYAIHIGSTFSIITEVILLIIEIIGIITFMINESKKVNLNINLEESYE